MEYRTRFEQFESNELIGLMQAQGLIPENGEKPVIIQDTSMIEEALDTLPPYQQGNPISDNQIRVIKDMAGKLRTPKIAAIADAKVWSWNQASVIIQNMRKLLDEVSPAQLAAVKKYTVCPDIDEPDEMTLSSKRALSGWIAAAKSKYFEWSANLATKAEYDEYKRLFKAVHGYDCPREQCAYITRQDMPAVLQWMRQAAKVDVRTRGKSSQEWEDEKRRSWLDERSGLRDTYDGTTYQSFWELPDESEIEEALEELRAAMMNK